MPGTASIRYTRVHSSALVRIEDYLCDEGAGGPSREEEPSGDSIVLVRRGAFQRHRGRSSTVANVNDAAFFSKGVASRVSHPDACGDRGTVLHVEPDTLRDIVSHADPRDSEREGPLFPFLSGPCSGNVCQRHLDLLRGLRSGPGDEALRYDEAALALVASVVKAAFDRAEATPFRRRDATLRDLGDRVNAMKVWLSRHAPEKVRLCDVARAAGLSPYHGARVFRDFTGTSIHRYLTGLRLRSAAEALAEGAADIGELAHAHGFSSHAHFTAAFRSAFGVTPSAWRAPRRTPPKRARFR